MITLSELIRENSEPSAASRLFRNIVNCIALSENLPISCFKTQTHRKKINRNTFFSAHADPFLTTLRLSDDFINEEDIFYSKKLVIPSTPPHDIFEPRSNISESYVSIFNDTIIEGFTFEFGPVWLKDNLPYGSLVDQALKENIITPLWAQFSSQSYSRNRLERKVFHRGAVSKADLVQRISRVKKIFETVLSTNLTSTTIHSDHIEEIVLLASFWNYHMHEIPKDGVTVKLNSSLYHDEDHHEANCLIERVSENKIRLLIGPPTSEAKPINVGIDTSNRLSRRWSRFAQDFITQRNSNYLEQILLLRLWCMEKFGGSSINQEEGVQYSEVFCELADKIQEMFGADGCNIYKYRPAGGKEHINVPSNARVGKLYRIGESFSYSEFRDQADKDAEFVERSGTDPELRSGSLCYQSLDNVQTIFRGNVEPEELALNGEKAPKSVLVTPLLSNDRVWGIIELVGKDTYQFPGVTCRWIEEIVRIITPIFYDQWMFFRFREISRIATSEIPSNDKYTEILTHVRRLLLGCSARLFIQHPRRTSEYEIKAHSGIPWPKLSTSFDLDDHTSISAATIKDENKIWTYDKINSDAAVCAQHPDTSMQPLFELGHKHAAWLPIRDELGNCFASIVITTSDKNNFNGGWRSLVETISQHLTVVLEAIHLQEKEILETKEFAAHSIKTRIDRLNDGTNRLLTLLEPLIGSEEKLGNMVKFLGETEALSSQNTRSNSDLSISSREVLSALRKTFPSKGQKNHGNVYSLPRLVDDLKKHASEVRSSAVVLAGGVNSENPNETSSALWNGTWANVRLSLIQSVRQQLIGEYRHIGIPDFSVLPPQCHFRVPDQILVEVINNIVDNAIKYDHARPSISLRARLSTNPDRLTIEVRNLAPRMTSEEAAKHRLGGYRSSYARIKDLTGTGVGINFCHAKADEWGFGFEYTIPTHDLSSPGKLGWHSAKLSFSGKNFRLENQHY